MTTLTHILNNRLAAFGGAILLLVLIIVLAVPFLPLADPDITEPAKRLQRPFEGSAFLGTDHLGRDLLSRLIWGTRLSLAVGIIAALAAALIGSAIGITAGFFGGRVDTLLMRGIDMLMAFPYILLALAIVAALGPGLLNALFAVAIVNVPFFARNLRGATVAIAHREFVDAARLSGMGRWRIIGSEILPNVLPVIVITMSTTIGWMILETAGLSFLGLGSQPPQADLGSMLGEGRKLLINAPHASIVPGAMIFVVVMCVNLLGDGVRDALDPRLRSGALTRPSAKTLIDRHGLPTKPATGNLLDVQSLKTEFRVNDRIHHAVGGVSFSIAPGECLGIIGESGSGKSVTALSLLGLVASPPGVITGGSIYVDGEDTLGMQPEPLRKLRGGKVAYIFQDPLSTLHPLHRIGDQLVEAARAHRPVSRQDAWQESVAMLERVRIPNAAARARSFPHELSGGMRQRVGIALALINQPDLVIADEPTTALDVTVQAEILALLDELRRERSLALIFITHDVGVVAQLCDRIAVMYAGRIVEMGPKDDLLEAPRHPYTRRLIDCVPALGAGRRRLATIAGLPPSAADLPVGCAFAPRCSKAMTACSNQEIELRDHGVSAVRCLYPEEAST